MPVRLEREGRHVNSTANRRMVADYVYIIEFEGEGIRHMTKVWNNVVSLKQLGWM